MAAVPLLKNESVGPDDEYDNEAAPVSVGWRQQYSPRQHSSKRHTLCLCLLSFVAGLATATGGAMLISSRLRTGNDACFHQTSMASPITRDLDISYHIQQFNGSLMKENVYRLPGSPEVDAAWEALGVNYRPLSVPQEIAGQVGLAPDQVKVNSKYGGGFPANVEGLHQLHCANLVRQALYYNIDYYRERKQGAFGNPEYVLRKHISHCLDIIRQQLMCSADAGVLGQVWFQAVDEKYPGAFVDFNTKHKCRNFDAIRQWAEERQMPEDVPDDWLEPPKPGDKIYHVVP